MEDLVGFLSLISTKWICNFNKEGKEGGKRFNSLQLGYNKHFH